MEYDEIKKILLAIPDPVEKLETVMDFSRHLAPIPQSAACAEISGCASRVRICRADNRFYGWADSALVRGVVAIIISMVDGKTPAQIKETDIGAEFAALRLDLGAGRMNGVNSMIRFLRNL
ncbi:MAG: SufE family protein [Rickettsiales bacterium]|jgi:cysteine desulfuration protein SufE|nr:SufE family protein [Rickettsiales bacterium]